MVRSSMAVLTLLICAGLALAQVPATMPGPTTSVAADQSTPQGTLILLTRAMQTGDSSNVKGLVHATTPEQQSLANVLVQSIEVTGRFRKAVTAVMGDGVADNYVGSAQQTAEAEKSISEAKVTIDKDTATVQASAGEDALKLTRIDGQWRISMAAVGGDDVKRTERDFKMLVDVLQSVTEDVAAGKLKTAEELDTAIRARKVTAILQSSGAATQPAPAKPDEKP